MKTLAGKQPVAPSAETWTINQTDDSTAVVVLPLTMATVTTSIVGVAAAA